MSVNASCRLVIVDRPDEIAKANSPKGKPFLRVTLEDGRTFDLTLNLGEMIGGAASGARQRFDDMRRAGH